VRVSVVIATSNRAASLRVTLEALRHQTYRDIEVVVVEGPCEDETPELLAERADHLKVVRNPQRNLCISRNLGTDVASGDVVAFVDDDAIPEPDWVEELAAAYADEEIGGAGGLVYDQTGVSLQYRYAVCHRLGHTDFDQRPPFDAFNHPGADPFVYLQGTNMSFRREVLEAVGGFDENIEYIWDEADLALRAIDAGWRLRPLDGAAVHHKMLPSHMRRGKGQVTDPFTPVKNRTYFALRNGMGVRPMEDILRSLTEYLDLRRRDAQDSEKHARFTAREARTFVERLEAGFEAGMDEGLNAERGTRALAPRDADAFLPYPVLEPDGGRLRLCLASLDFPPASMGGIARYTADLGRGLAAAGHEVHVVTRSEPPYRLDFEDGIWVHRYPEGGRLLPALEGHPLRDNLAHTASVWHAIDRAAARRPLDLVTGNVWFAETVLSAIDPRWPTVMVCSTPIRTIAATQGAVASKSESAWQAKLEDAAIARATHLVPLSEANLRTVVECTSAAKDVPTTVVWLGMADRAGGPLAPPQPDDGTVEILFTGRLEPRKGVDDLLDATIELLRERPRVRLRLVGADNPYASDDPRPYATRVDERLGADRELRTRIVFEGEVDDDRLNELLAGCDIFCAPSLYESFGLINVEAMMFSRPVVSCAAGGIPEVVADGETGLLAAPGDVAGLRDALRTLVDDEALRHRMGRAGRERYECEFADDVMVARMLALFRDVLAEHPPATVEPSVAEAAVRSGVEGLLAEIDEIAEVTEVAEAAEQLLDPTAFPHDYRATIARLHTASDRDFVAGLYAEVLRREPEPGALDAMTLSLSTGARTRYDVIRAMVTSDEAKLLGVDPAFLARLGAHEPSEIERRVRDAFWRGDDDFPRLLVGALLELEGDDGAAEAESVRTQLAHGTQRRDVLRELLRRPQARKRLPDAAVLAETEFLTTGELAERLTALALLDDETFVAEAYRLLLDRDPDPDGLAGWRARLASIPRSHALIEIAATPEAQRRGIDQHVIGDTAARVPALTASPARGTLGRMPGSRRAGWRVLRDPELGRLHDRLDRHATRSEEAVGELTALISSTRDAEALERLKLETQGLDERLAAIEGAVNSLQAAIARVVHRPDPPTTHAAYVGGDRLLVGTIWGGKLLTPTRDLSITPDLVANGVYEPGFTRYLMQTLRQGMTVVDVGANIGMYTVLMAGLVGAEGRVAAYEPNPDLLGLLRENVALNWLNDRVTIKPMAASSAAGTLTLHVTERFMGNSSLLEPDTDYFANVPMDTTRAVEVEAEPLDALARELGHVDLVKIDVEGAERFVLEGMAEMLRGGSVDRVTFEVYRARMGDEWGAFAELLRELDADGWEFASVSDEGAQEPLELQEILDVGRYAQVVMTRP
jgi:FkbM family methyltransferase